MNEREWLAEQFEENRPRLRGVAYRMLGSLAEADDAVQESWLRLDRSRADSIDNLGAWLTTVVGRVCLDMLRARPPVVGAAAVARQILARGTPLAPLARPAIVNGAAGAVVAVGGRPLAVVGFTVRGGRIVTIDLVADRAKLRRLQRS